MNSYNSIEKILNLIETRKFENISSEILSREAYLSGSHLQRLFKLTTGQSLMDYVRGRKLAHSLEELLKKNISIAGIAIKYGFLHEQSYIRAFKKEYGCSPGKARREKVILPIRERISPESIRTASQGGIIYGPEIVMLPPFNLVGKPHKLPRFIQNDLRLEPNRLGVEFYFEAIKRIRGAISPEVYYAVTSSLPGGVFEGIEYMPCLQVKDLLSIPDGYEGRKFPALKCVRFRYVGNHPIEEISMVTAKEIYDVRWNYFLNQTRYVQRGDIRHFERIDTRLYEGGYCCIEIMPPIIDTLEE